MSVVATETATLLRKKRPNGKSDSASTKLCHSQSLGSRRGGTASTSPFERMAFETIQKKGKRKAIASSTTKMWRTMLPMVLTALRCLTSGIVVHPFALQAQLHRGQHHDDDEEDPGDRGGVAEIVADEAVAIDLIAERLGGSARPATRQRIDLVEDLEAGDRGQDNAEEQRGRNQRQLDAPEALPGGGAIDRRSIEILLGNGFERRAEEQQIVAEAGPERDDHHALHGPGRVGDHVGQRDVQRAHHPIEKTTRGEDQEPNDRRADERGEGREEEHQPEEVIAPFEAGERHG